jgi:hypothetical protein
VVFTKKERRMIFLKVPGEIPREQLAQDLGLTLSKNSKNGKECLLTPEGNLFSDIEVYDRAFGAYFFFLRSRKYPEIAKRIEELKYIAPFLKK